MNILENWFDKLKEVLDKEAEFAGILSHPGTVGSAREFFVRKFLKSFLPDFIHIGTGQIFDCKDNRSKQIDVVIFNSNFPYLKGPDGLNLYPLEGTIATIEVKSNLKKKELIQSLDNCLSVNNLVCQMDSSNDSHISRIDKEHGLKVKEDAEALYMSAVMPATYIWGFKGVHKNHESFAKIIHEWLAQVPGINRNNIPLPSIVSNNHIIMRTKDEFQRFHEANRIAEATSAPNLNHLGLVASHLMHKIAKLDEKGGKIHKYIPIDNYNNLLKNIPNTFIRMLN